MHLRCQIEREATPLLSRRNLDFTDWALFRECYNKKYAWIDHFKIAAFSCDCVWKRRVDKVIAHYLINRFLNHAPSDSNHWAGSPPYPVHANITWIFIDCCNFYYS